MGSAMMAMQHNDRSYPTDVGGWDWSPSKNSGSSGGDMGALGGFVDRVSVTPVQSGASSCGSNGGIPYTAGSWCNSAMAAAASKPIADPALRFGRAPRASAP